METSNKRQASIMYALDTSGEKIPAEKGRHAACPCCRSKVIAKCGEKRRWHWAHQSNDDCDSWSEGETEWHLHWKNLLPKQNVEVVLAKDGVVHRADILTDEGCVIELQHSPISPEEIRQREDFYGKMFWLFDARTARVWRTGETQNRNSIREEDCDWIFSCHRHFEKKHTYPVDSGWRKTSHWKIQTERLVTLIPQLAGANRNTLGEMLPLWMEAYKTITAKEFKPLYPGTDHYGWNNPWARVIDAKKPRFLHLDKVIFKITHHRIQCSRFDGTARPIKEMEDWLKAKCKGNPTHAYL